MLLVICLLIGVLVCLLGRKWWSPAIHGLVDGYYMRLHMTGDYTSKQTAVYDRFYSIGLRAREWR